MPVLSHLHQLFNAEQCQAYLTFPYLPHSYHRYGFALEWS